MSAESEEERAAPIIDAPANNSEVRNGEIDVSVTSSSTGTMIARLYTFSGNTAISEGRATQAGNRWSARLPGIFAPGPYRVEVAQGGTAMHYVTLRVTPVTIALPPLEMYLTGSLPSAVMAVSTVWGRLPCIMHPVMDF